MEVMVVSSRHDLAKLVEEINRSAWDERNEMSTYDEGALRAYLDRQDTVFVACFEAAPLRSKLMGMGSARLELKPYGHERWLYVDEVDVCADQRQKGAGKRIMQKLIEIAEKRGCDEVWLGAEVGNDPANALYRSLHPDDVSEVVGYTFETDGGSRGSADSAPDG